LRRFHALSPPTAQQLAAVTGTALETIGIVVAKPPSSIDQRHSLEAAICAAAEALDLSPRLVRPAARAFLLRLAEANLSTAEAAALAEQMSKVHPSGGA
jgi:hypothetical protein